MEGARSSRNLPLSTVGQRFFHTVRHLKPQQVLARMRLALARPTLKPLPPPGRRAPERTPVDGRRRHASMQGENSFRLLNEPGEVRTASHWNDPSRSKLWLYNLHYFDDLNSVGAEERHEWHVSLVERWVAQNPPMLGVGWEPYPLSLRSVNWIAWDLRTGGLSSAATASLAQQLRWLRKRLEYHLLGNHLLANAKALIFGGLYFEGQEAQEWLAAGMEIFSRQLEEQILPDGGHFELSPMYHLIVLEDVLDTVNLLTSFGRAAPSDWLAKANEQLAWAQAMQHPDGQIPFFNDAAFGVAGSPADLRAYAERLSVLIPALDPGGARTAKTQAARCSLAFPASGYVRLASADAVLFFDAAAVGPDYLPGHAHADTLSVELSLFGSRVLVNSGTSTYAPSPERQRQRGTAAHNTLRLDGEDSSEVWGSFRVARRARVSSYLFESAGNHAQAAHDGYRRLRGRPLHRRSVRVVDGRVEVQDIVERQTRMGPPNDVELIWHFHPEVDVQPLPHAATEAAGPGEPVRSWQVHVPVGHGSRQALLSVSGEVGSEPYAALDATLESSTWHPEFGAALPNKRLVVRARLNGSAVLTTTLQW